MFNQTNSAKSSNGYSLNAHVASILNKLKSQGIIKNFKLEPKYNYPGFLEKQFNPDCEIEKLNGEIIVIDNTTSARSDRLKQKQWEAVGVKAFFSNDVSFFVVLPDELSPTETNNYLHEKAKIRSSKRISAIDDLIQIQDLVHYLHT